MLQYVKKDVNNGKSGEFNFVKIIDIYLNSTFKIIFGWTLLMLKFDNTFDDKFNKLVGSKLKVAQDVTENLDDEDTRSSHFRNHDGKVGVTSGVVRDHSVYLLVQVERCAYISLQTSIVVYNQLAK